TIERQCDNRREKCFELRDARGCFLESGKTVWKFIGANTWHGNLARTLGKQGLADVFPRREKEANRIGVERVSHSIVSVKRRGRTRYFCFARHPYCGIGHGPHEPSVARCSSLP